MAELMGDPRDPDVQDGAPTAVDDVPGLVLETAPPTWHALTPAAEALQTNLELLLEAVKSNWQALETAAAKLRAERGLALETVPRGMRSSPQPLSSGRTARECSRP